MSNKNQATKADLVFDGTKIVLKSVYDKANIKYFIQPCRDKYGNLPLCIKKINSQGDMIMSDTERNAFSEGKVAFFPENKIFEVTHGKSYNLDNMWEAAEWEAIKNCPLIAKSRDEKDANGNYIIDGVKVNPKIITQDSKPVTYGVAELYIDRPGLETQRKVSRKQLIHKACSYVYNDDRGIDGQRMKVRLLGKNMDNQPAADVIDYLISIAEQDPNKIINLYTGGDTQLRLLFIEAKDKKVIYVKNKLYVYGDNIVLGATDDAVIAWMKQPHNMKLLELIKKDTFPDLYEKEAEA